MKTQIQKEYRIEDKTVICPRVPKSANIDGQFAVGLWYGDSLAAYGSISRGIENYYDNKYFPEIWSKLENEWIIVQIQKGRAEIQMPGQNFRNILTRFVVDCATEAGISRIYMMSSSRNLWNIQKVKNDMADCFHPLPNEKTLQYNYDWTAKRNHFRLDSETGLYVRELSRTETAPNSSQSSQPQAVERAA